MAYTIEKDIPMTGVAGGGRVVKYPFGAMAVGDSVLIEGLKHKPVNAAYAFGKDNGMRFKSRVEGDGYRIWRVA